MERKCSVSSRKTMMRVKSRRRSGFIRLTVCPTTGGRMDLSVSPRESISGLKAALARRLRVSPTKLTLIYKNKVLKDGCLQDHQILDQSHLTLLPNMESGLSLHHTDKSIIQALENLTETQVSDFLSGRSPLMLAIHMGENMVYVQLQLSMLQGQSQNNSRTNASPAAASILSRMGFSPSSSIAEASRRLSQGFQRLHAMNVSSNLQPSTSATATPGLHQPCVASQPQNNPTLSSLTSQSVTSALKVPHLPKKQPCSSLDENSATGNPSSSGAVIDSMKHLGHGVYTGTFQGTLDASLQDDSGRPRRSVSTIMHILNDLLVAVPRCPGQGHAVVSMQTQYQGRLSSAPQTLPSSPLCKSNEDVTSVSEESDENMMLRDKMRRIQMMLAQRKEQRRARREMNAPYHNQRSPQKVASTNILSSLFMSSQPPETAAAVCMAASTTSATESTDTNDSTDGNGSSSDPSSTYCTLNIEHDSLAV